MTRTRRALGFAVTSVIVACGLFPSLDDLDSARDAAPDVALSDGPLSDVALDVGDASNDAPASTRFCATLDAAPFYCEDFDEPEGIDASAVGAVVVSGGGAIAVTTANSLSPPRSLLASSPTIDASTNVQSAVYINFPIQTFTTATLSFDTSVTMPIQSTFNLGSIFMSNGSSLVVVITTTSAFLQEGTFTTAPQFVNHTGVAVDLTKSAWHHVTLRIDTAPLRSSLMIDQAIIEADHPLDARFTIAGKLGAGVGMTFVGGPATARTAYADNIVVTYAP